MCRCAVKYSTNSKIFVPVFILILESKLAENHVNIFYSKFNQNITFFCRCIFPNIKQRCFIICMAYIFFQDIEDSIFYTMDTICDLVYLLDIFVHLRISFYEDGCLVRKSTSSLLQLSLKKYKKVTNKCTGLK